MWKLITKIFDSNEKQLDKHRLIVNQINDLEPSIQNLSDDELSESTQTFRKQLNVDLDKARLIRDPFLSPLTNEEKVSQIKEDRDALMEIMPDVFARVREAAWRTTRHRHFDVQVLGAIFQSKGYVTELFTGEGKTLVASMPLFLYGLMGKTAHLITANDYLSRRDGEWSGHIYNALGMSLGIVTQGAAYKFISDDKVLELKGEDGKKQIEDRKALVEEIGRLTLSSMDGLNLIQCTKKEAYACDILYGSNNELGFDYLRDNMARDLEQRVQSPLYFGIVDECDSILIDEARTPLIISSPAEESNDLYRQFANVVRNLESEADYIVDEKSRAVSLTDEGVDHVEKILGIDNIWENYSYVHHLDNALKAKELNIKDDQYIVRNNEILIVDEFTGRAMSGRRYSEGLHQAIEAKEGVEIKRESRTLATITFQNFFRLYDNLAGMTATALTEAEEFAEIFDLEVIVVPTNVPVLRKDYPDVVYRTKEGKYKAVVEEIKSLYEEERPVLVGTTSVETSEMLSAKLRKEGVPHNVLNAKNHEKEAKIVADAGQKGQVTIATNMAGRGTDIALGSGVKDLGGLHIIGTERHESRRIDNQLRGRSGRQGDPGSSRFYVSFEDDLMRLFGGDSMGTLMSRVGMTDDMPVEAALIGRTIESAQKRVEAYHFDTRKHLVEYDDVLNQQREIIYDLRRRILTILKQQAEDEDSPVLDFNIADLDLDFVENLVDELDNFNIKQPDSWDIEDWKSSTLINKPLRLWILKLAINQVDYLLNSQVKDDSKIDDEEEKKVLAGILDIVPVELGEIVARKLKYKNLREFEDQFDKTEDAKTKKNLLIQLIVAAYVHHIENIGDHDVTELERILILQTLDNLWMEHLDVMTDLRHGIGLRGYANKNPLVEYKNEGFRFFDQMLAQMEDNIIKRFFKVRIVRRSANTDINSARTVHEQFSSSDKDDRPGKVSKQKTVVKSGKVGRNDPCPCGSGKKYKKCCGKNVS